MAMNRVQVQTRLAMADFMHRYGTEAQCEPALIGSRWPQGVICPSCRGYLSTTFNGLVPGHARADSSQEQCLVAGIDAPSGVGYSTVWRMKHKILQTLMSRESGRQLSGRAEIDDSYLSEEQPGKRGRGSPNKVPFVIAVSTVGDNRPIKSRFIARPSPRMRSVSGPI